MTNVLSHSEVAATLKEMSNKERLDAYNLILAGCTHLWSKGKMQEDKVKKVLQLLIPLTKEDPIFLAHLTSYVFKDSNAHDLQVMTTFANALSDADGTPFSPGSKYLKPNLRYVSAAAIQHQHMSPKYVFRVAELWALKFGVENFLSEARHHPRQLRGAISKYLKHRALDIKMMESIKKAGMAHFVQKTYRLIQERVPDEVAAIIRWHQRDRDIKFADLLIDFRNLDDLQIAEKIRKDRIPALSVFGGLMFAKKKLSPAIAVAILEQSSGDQAVVLQDVFKDQGILDDPEVLKLYEQKILQAKSTLDRVDTISKNASEAVKRVMKSARAEVRKEQVGDVGKIYMMIDVSGSMTNIVQYAAEKASIFAECVKDPVNNFKWGLFESTGHELPLPQEFVTDAFRAILYNVRGGGGTDIGALFPNARQFGAEIDVIISDGEHGGFLTNSLLAYMRNHPDWKPPKVCVFVNFGNPEQVAAAYNAIGTPVAIIEPQVLSSSAMVSDVVRAALKGPLQVVEDIMNTPLLTLPRWYMSI